MKTKVITQNLQAEIVEQGLNQTSPHPTEPTKYSRRNFLAATGTVATFLALPAHVLGRGGEPSPNSKLNIAGIGIGGQGGNDIDEVSTENIVALCDVDDD